MDEDAEQRAVNAASYVLLFFLVFGLSGTIDLAAFREKFKQVRGRSPAAGEAMPERMALLRHRAAPAADAASNPPRRIRLGSCVRESTLGCCRNRKACRTLSRCKS